MVEVMVMEMVVMITIMTYEYLLFEYRDGSIGCEIRDNESSVFIFRP